MPFSETALRSQLADLRSSKASIEGLSRWINRHHSHHTEMVEIWLEEFVKLSGGGEDRQICFLYLVNDVVQRGKRCGSMMVKAFVPALSQALQIFAQSSVRRNKQIILRILLIWRDRHVYDHKQMIDFIDSFEEAWQNYQVRTESREEEDEGISLSQLVFNNYIDDYNAEIVHHKDLISVKLPGPRNEESIDSIEELMKVVNILDDMPSADSETRQIIASFPCEVSGVAEADAYCSDSVVAAELQRQITDASSILENYNDKLDGELQQRLEITMKLQNLVGQQKQCLSDAEERLNETKNQIELLQKCIAEVNAHVYGLPDFSLPFFTANAPLPSVQDLFFHI